MSTVKSSQEVQALFERSRRVAHPLVVALIASTPPGRGPEGRVAFIAGKRIGGAVARNRAKRVLRAAVRRIGGPWPGHDVALIARDGTGAVSGADLDEALRRVIDRAGLS